MLLGTGAKDLVAGLVLRRDLVGQPEAASITASPEFVDAKRLFDHLPSAFRRCKVCRRFSFSKPPDHYIIRICRHLQNTLLCQRFRRRVVFALNGVYRWANVLEMLPGPVVNHR